MTSISSEASPLRYPASPENIDHKILEPSPSFRREVKKVLASIVFFIVTYLVLVIAAVTLAIACGLGGILLIAALPKPIVIIIGVGLLGLGIMVLIFLFKFMFKNNKVDRSHLMEVTEKDQTMLFVFLRTLAKETQTPLPKHVYLSPDVNASVFYDSSFWSMFLPVRKNLQIGLGLVNSVNVSEFKAVIAHEFGHFSQRSMKLGSYVYNVNHIIYNMLYDNDGYANTLNTWGNVHGIFALFAGITIRIVKGIQWILQGLYGIINKRHMALSREMEFHADTVAASVSGSAPLISALQRFDAASLCYDAVLNYYNRWYRENKKGNNLYPAHTEVMKHFAEENGLPIEHGLVQVTAESFTAYNKSRVVIKDQWASHPDTNDREAHLRKLNINTRIQTESAWTLFHQPEVLQKKITDGLYNQLSFNGTPESVDFNAFSALYKEEVKRFELDKRYKGFYDGRAITPFDIDTVINEQNHFNSLEEILTPETVGLPDLINGIENDIRVLEGIQNKKSGIKTFEFEGKKYARRDSFALVEKLKKELEVTKAALEKADKDIFRFYFAKAKQLGKQDEFCKGYGKMFEIDKATESAFKEIEELTAPLQQVYVDNVTEQTAEAVAFNLKRDEASLKEKMKAVLENNEFAGCYTPEDKKSIENYLQQVHDYFSKHSGFNNEAFTTFNEAVGVYSAILSDKQFDVKKQLLNHQFLLA